MVALWVAEDFEKVATLSAATLILVLVVVARQVGEALYRLLLKLKGKLNFIFSGDWLKKMSATVLLLMLCVELVVLGLHSEIKEPI
jgi:hypothetical protein